MREKERELQSIDVGSRARRRDPGRREAAYDFPREG